MKGQRVMMCALTVALLLALGVAGTRAQGQQPQDGTSAINGLSVELNDAIPIQGRLTDENGVPLDGVFDIRFAVYDVATSGTPLCQDTDVVGVDNGLFNANLDGCTSSIIDGRQLWLGVKVGSDAEMLYRRPMRLLISAASLAK